MFIRSNVMGILVLSLFVSGISSVAIGETREEKGDTTVLVVTGILVNAEGSPIPGKTVWLMGKDYSIKVGDAGRVLNPTAQTDAKGAFKLKVDRRTFPPNEEIGVAYEYKEIPSGMTRYALLLDKNGVPVLFKIDKAAKTVDIGKVTVSER